MSVSRIKRQEGNMAETKILALCGKGGVGKTSIGALMIKILSSQDNLKTLAIDADPAVGLASALGVTARKTVDDIRRGLIKTIKDKDQKDKRQTLNLINYELFDALTQEKGFSLLAIGRPEDEGCFCKVNSLLKDIIQNLCVNFDVVLIDGEAGIEQINRRVMKTVDNLILVSDTSVKGLGVANTIAHVAQDNKAVECSAMGLILNRVRSRHEVDDIRSRTSLDIYGWIDDDDLIRDFDFKGTPLSQYPDASTAVRAISGILKKMGIYS
jgi:CO dehydrogenase maturation factor